MASGLRVSSFIAFFVAGCMLLLGPPTATAQTTALDDILGSIVKIEARVPSSARSARTLGTERSGSGAVIDGEGLIVTIGYIVTDATDVTVTAASGAQVPAELVAYDYETGLGLVRTLKTLNVKPIRLGDSDRARERSPTVIAGFGGKEAVRGAYVVSRRTFTGYWEYMMEDAVYTAPFYESFGGAALLDAEGRLIGVGYVAVGDAAGPGTGVAGNMFVPINRLKAILPDMIEHGRGKGAGRPWLGVQTHEMAGRLLVMRVNPESPASQAGIKQGDILLTLNGQPLDSQADFYRRLWISGEPGTTVEFTVLQGVGIATLRVRTVDRNTLFPVGRAN